MKQAGFVSIGFSLESAVPRILRTIGKVNPPNKKNSENIEREIEFIELGELIHWVDLEREFDFHDPIHFEEHVRALCDQFPHESKGIRQFYNKYANVVRWMMEWFTKSALGKISFVLTNLNTFFHFIRALNKPISKILDPYISDITLKEFISAFAISFGYFREEMSAILFVMSEMSYRFEGAWYPKGGAGALSKMLTEIYLKNGGTLKVGAEVKKLQTKGKKIESILYNDKRNKKEVSIKGNYVISDIDLTKLVNEMCIPNTFSKKYIQRINQRKTTYSSIIISLGIDLDLKKIGIDDYELWRFYASNANKEDLNRSTDNLNFENIPIELITCYSNLDPTCCPEGKSIISLIYYTNFEPWKKFLEANNKKSKQYYQFKEELGNVFINKIEKALKIENLREKIEVVDVATPLTLHGYTHNRNGANFGWRLNPKMQMTQAIRNKSSLKNLFLCGQWVMPGASISATSSTC